jgi:1-deoxy-D-xylulose-5-phosphate reductoisomerase
VTEFNAGELGWSGRRRVSILGATGSVGASTLDLIERNADRFEVVALTAATSVDDLADAAIRHDAALAVIADPGKYEALKSRLAGSRTQPAAGPEALCEAAAMPADCTVAAIVGAAGLQPTMAAVRAGRRIALANKECLVAAGDLFTEAVRQAGAELIPVDSEHSAIFQLIDGRSTRAIEKITLTASGGPFRTWSLEELACATPEQAVRHPNWSMGHKISVDSATLMNKGLELIEAFHLFDIPHAALDVVVHPQSIVHCLVAYQDGSVLAQLACPDMRTPIAVGLSWPCRMPAPTARLDLTMIGSLDFEAPDYARFPALATAKAALARGDGAPAVLNASNEIAVEAFLQGRAGFLDIAMIVAKSVEIAEARGLLRQPRSLEDVFSLDHEARVLARTVIERLG